MKDPKGRTKPGFEHHIFICENGAGGGIRTHVPLRIGF